jgi:DNA-binding SARP family transcriptional activator
MLELRTFGGLSVAGHVTPPTGATTSRRQLALLVLLAASGERGLSRDKALAYLWPEGESERARHALNQTLYALRRTLGEDAVTSGGAELRLNPNVMIADVADFEAALRRGDRARAAALYTGPFLDGFFLDDAPEFERWTESERSRLAQRLSGAMQSLATEASARGDHQAAAEWWRRLAAAEPLNSRVALSLMTALVESGDRGGALRHARAHTSLLREELDVAPDPAIAALARQLREEPMSGQSRGATVAPISTRPARPSLLRDGAAQSHQRYLAHLRKALAERYELGDQLERGGIATAFAARDLMRGRAVTLKIVHPSLAALLDAGRFTSGMRKVSDVVHANVAQLIDVGDIDGVVYYTMARVEGDTLRARLARERQLPLADALRIAHDIAGALVAAHAAGVLHLDLKPRHVVLADGGVVVLELGVAPAVAAAAGDAVTQSGVTLGTPGYMSPEQASGERHLDGRSDVYSLGCILYHMLAGEPPFAGPTAQAVLIRRLTESVPALRASRDSVPPAVERALATMLARVPADRYATAGDVRLALGELAEVAPRRDAARLRVR